MCNKFKALSIFNCQVGDLHVALWSAYFPSAPVINPIRSTSSNCPPTITSYPPPTVHSHLLNPDALGRGERRTRELCLLGSLQSSVMTVFMSWQTAVYSPLGYYTSTFLKCLSGSKTVCMLVTPVIVWFLLLAWKLWKLHVSLKQPIQPGIVSSKNCKIECIAPFLCDRKELLAIYFEEQLISYFCSKALIIFKPINIYSLKKSFNGNILVSLFIETCFK